MTKKLFLIILLTMIFLSGCCQFCRNNCVREKIVYVYNVPIFPCPEKIKGVWEEYSIKKSNKENLIVTLNNIEMAKRLMKNRDNIILCYTKNLKLYRQRKTEVKKDEIKKK